MLAARVAWVVWVVSSALLPETVGVDVGPVGEEAVDGGEGTEEGGRKGLGTRRESRSVSTK